MPESIILYMPRPDSVRLIACSPPSWMVQIALVHKGIDHEIEFLAFDRG